MYNFLWKNFFDIHFFKLKGYGTNYKFNTFFKQFLEMTIERNAGSSGCRSPRLQSTEKDKVICILNDVPTSCQLHT